LLDQVRREEEATRRREEARLIREEEMRQEARRLAWQERELRLREEAQLRAAVAEQRATPDPHSAWEEALWSPWTESPARSSHNNASPPEDIVDGDGDEAHRD
jgi:hypothetical protein